MVNYACAFSQSELRKYFEWMIIIVTYLSYHRSGSVSRIVRNHENNCEKSCLPSVTWNKFLNDNHKYCSYVLREKKWLSTVYSFSNQGISFHNLDIILMNRLSFSKFSSDYDSVAFVKNEKLLYTFVRIARVKSLKKRLRKGRGSK